MAGIIFLLILLFITIDYLLERLLEYLNLKSWNHELPKEVRDLYDEQKYKQSQLYNQETQKLSFWSNTATYVFTLLMLLFGGYAFLDELVRSMTEEPVLMSLLFLGILGILGSIIGLPFSLYSTFVIEEKFGFNRTTAKIFVMDLVKGLLLVGIIGGILLAIVIWFYDLVGSGFWIYAWGLITCVSFFMTIFYTSFIVPIFNKLSPLESGDLRSAIEDFCFKVSFPLENIFVIDGSKRSSKANAYFSGMGKKKSIVLFDTLIEDHSVEELVSILAHEVGHYKKKHIQKGFVLSTLNMGITLFLFSLLIDSPELAKALGAEKPSFHLGIVAFSLLYGPISTLTGVLMNAYSRKNEFEADEFAKINYNKTALIESLKKLSVKHLSNLNPHPAYVFFHYSHPPLLERLRALEK